MKLRIFSLFFAALLLLSALCSCQSETGDESGTTMISFSQTNTVESLKALNGKRVSIIGYMSTLSPVSGKFMYLMNLPYQSCPFCVPNTTQLSNTMAVYAKDKKGFAFTDRAIQVIGTLNFGDFTDEYGYTYNYRIEDATYTEVDTSMMDEKMKQWQALASTDVIAEIYNMYEYVNFLCYWNTYTAKFAEGEDYLYPSDALNFIEPDGSQFNYGFKEGYFDRIIATVESVDATAFKDLVENIRKAEALCEYAYGELKAGRYSTEKIYSEYFKEERTRYYLLERETVEKRMDEVYGEFSRWIASWEL